MPASEKTWHNIRLLHVVFGLTALGMLLATVWMLFADHNRQWKRYQRAYRKVEAWRTAGRLREEQTLEYPERVRKAREALEAAQSEVPPADLVEEFRKVVAENDPDFNWDPVQAAYEALAAQPGPATRSAFIGQLETIISNLKVREENALRELKFARADLDVVRSELGIAIGHGVTASEERRLRGNVERMRDVVREKTIEYHAISTYRQALEDLLAEINADVVKAQKELDAANAEIERLHTALKEQTISPGEGILEWPILSAFNSPDRIEQVWLPELKIDYNFKKVARFDRCITCHQGIQRTAPGSATEPFIEHEHRVTLELATDNRPVDEEGNPLQPTMDRLNDFLDAAYGMLLADSGVLAPNDVTVHVVYPESPAAKAGLLVGDVIEQVNDARIIDKETAMQYLLEIVDWGKPLKLVVRRGLPHPYASHPRLDLYLGSFSPHKMMEFGCTICHEGQGSATEFRWAAHSPNDPLQRQKWREKYGWVSSHYVGHGNHPPVGLPHVSQAVCRKQLSEMPFRCG